MSKTIGLLCALLLGSSCWGATTCRIVSGGGLAFGNYDVLSPTPNDSLLNVAVSFTRAGGPQTVTLTMQLSQGTHGSSASARRMGQIGGLGDSLSYGLYRDVSRTSVWESSNGVDTVSVMLTVPNNAPATTNFTIYGRVPAQQDVSVGSYADNVRITLSP